MSRFFKSAAFPILIVIVLAFFAQKLISPGSQTEPPTDSAFLQQLQAGQVRCVDLTTKDNTVDVTRRSGQRYEAGLTSDGADRLDAQLQAAKGRGQLAEFDI